VQYGSGQWAVMPCGWEGNRRSGVALAMRHRLQWFIYLRAHGPRKGDEPTLLMGYDTVHHTGRLALDGGFERVGAAVK